MGQKSNLLTIKKIKKVGNLASLNSQSFIKGHLFLDNLLKLLKGKNIYLVKKEFQSENNNFFLNLSLFFCSRKLVDFRKRDFKKQQYSKKSIHFFKNKGIKKLFKSLFQFSKSITVNVKTVNNFLIRSDLIFLYKTFDRFNKILFPRRFSLFIDFIKMTSLFSQSNLSSNLYLYILGNIFKVLPKNKHGVFLSFLKSLFQTLVVKQSLLENSKILGVKFLISGKLKGKPRSSTSCIQVGRVPIQSVSKSVNFSKLNVYTLGGAFGFKMWVYKK